MSQPARHAATPAAVPPAAALGPIAPPRADPAVLGLLEAARRASRGGAPRSVLMLHLNAITLPRPHHFRVARAVLTDIAQRLEGEVLRLQTGELALTCRHLPASPDAAGPDGDGPDGLPAVLTRLFGDSAPDAPLFTLFHLPADGERLASYLAPAAFAAPEPPLPPPPIPLPNPLAVVGALLDFTALPELMRRQTAIRLTTEGASRTLAPCFREITCSIEALEARIAAYGQAEADPFVFRHLTARLDDRMLGTLARQLDRSLPGAIAPVRDRDIRLHVNLAVPGILSDRFAQLAAICRARQVPLGVEVSLVDACATPDAFGQARARLAEAGVALVLDGVSPEAMAMTRLSHLGAALIKLDWNPSLLRLAGLARGRLHEALQAAGAERVVLARAETEAALAWGVMQGITMFQGRHVDAMLAAGRIVACAHSAGCGLRQCIDRAAAACADGRRGCLDAARLDGEDVDARLGRLIQA